MSSNQKVLTDALGSWNAGDLEGYLKLYDENIRLYGYSPQPMGKGEVRQFYQHIFMAFGKPKLAFHDVLWQGDACAIRFTMTGRHVALFMGTPGTGIEIVLPGITMLHFSNSRVVERHSQADMLGLLVQIGAVKLPG